MIYPNLSSAPCTSKSLKNLVELIVTLCRRGFSVWPVLLPTSNSQKRLYFLCSEEESKLRPAYSLLLLLYSTCLKKLEGIIVTMFRRGFSVWPALLSTSNSWKKLEGIIVFLYFWRARVCWPFLCLYRPFCIYGSCLVSNPESCRSKQARY